MFDSLSDRLRHQLKSLDRKTIVIGTAVAVGSMAIAGGGFFYAPYITIDNIKNATTNRNSDALSREINFPELRTSFKENIKEYKTGKDVISELKFDVTNEIILEPKSVLILELK